MTSEQQETAIQALREIAIFRYRVDARLSADYENGWNDAIAKISADANAFLKSIGRDDPEEEAEFALRQPGNFPQSKLIAEGVNMAVDVVGIHELNDDELQRSVLKLRLAGFAPEREIHAEIINAAKNEAADLNRLWSPSAERFFQAMIERGLLELPTEN